MSSAPISRKTLIDCETFLKIIPCSHGPHLTREKTAIALKTSCLIYYTGNLLHDQALNNY
ncbi:hypothetical protein FYM75_09760 [Lactobacillus salivarius]|nr:hypothetical protein [Ligilactobacillus salivarius]